MKARRLLLTAMTAPVSFVALNVGRASATEVGVQRPVGAGLVAGSSPGLTYGEIAPSLAFGPSVFFIEGGARRANLPVMIKRRL